MRPNRSFPSLTAVIFSFSSRIVVRWLTILLLLPISSALAAEEDCCSSSREPEAVNVSSQLSFGVEDASCCEASSNCSVRHLKTKCCQSACQCCVQSPASSTTSVILPAREKPGDGTDARLLKIVVETIPSNPFSAPVENRLSPLAHPPAQSERIAFLQMRLL